MSELEALNRDHERTIEELRTRLQAAQTNAELWQDVAQCRLCLPYRLCWCGKHKDNPPTPKP